MDATNSCVPVAGALLLGAGGAPATSLAGDAVPAPSVAAASASGATSGNATAFATRGPTGAGMMGGPTMGRGAQVPRGALGPLVPGRRMEALAQGAARAVHRRGSTLSYRERRVTLVALGAPGSRPGMYWQLDDVDGATVSVPYGATVTVDFADGDPGHPHGFELTTAVPPYRRMAMLSGRVAAPGAFVMPVPPPDGNLWHAASVTFRAPPSGTYYIVCPVPGHAQQGMWSKFVVR